MRLGSTLLALALMVGCAARTATEQPAAPRKPVNVLMIAIDDLKPELGCYGKSYIHSPNIDRLAASGMLFRSAYCQQAVCAPTRVSLLTGCRPDTTKVTDLQTPLPTVRPDLMTMPTWFRQHGYTTISLGKIYHHAGKDDPKGWSQEPWRSGAGLWALPENRKIQSAGSGTGNDPKRPPPFESADVADDAYPDGQTANEAIAQLNKLKDGPFFLAVGFVRPHLPFNSPKKYWDLYDHSKVNLADNPQRPKGAPDIAFTTWGELRSYDGTPKSGPVSDELARNLVHGYYAAVSYTDAQIGKVLAELDRLGLAENTVVVLWGDHGWHLGDHGMWTKHTNFESAVRVPLIFKGPGVPTGIKSDALVEFVDVFPSLCQLASLPAPDGLEGTGVKPLMAKPERPWKQAAFSQYPHDNRMGRSVTDGRYRFTRWPGKTEKAPTEYELYDHQTDPAENTNLAADPSSKPLVARFNKMLDQGWRSAVPAN